MRTRWLASALVLLGALGACQPAEAPLQTLELHLGEELPESVHRLTVEVYDIKDDRRLVALERVESPERRIELGVPAERLLNFTVTAETREPWPGEPDRLVPAYVGRQNETIPLMDRVQVLKIRLKPAGGLSGPILWDRVGLPEQEPVFIFEDIDRERAAVHVSRRLRRRFPETVAVALEEGRYQVRFRNLVGQAVLVGSAPYVVRRQALSQGRFDIQQAPQSSAIQGIQLRLIDDATGEVMDDASQARCLAKTPDGSPDGSPKGAFRVQVLPKTRDPRPVPEPGRLRLTVTATQSAPGFPFSLLKTTTLPFESAPIPCEAGRRVDAVASFELSNQALWVAAASLDAPGARPNPKRVLQLEAGFIGENQRAIGAGLWIRLSDEDGQLSDVGGGAPVISGDAPWLVMGPIEKQQDGLYTVHFQSRSHPADKTIPLEIQRGSLQATLLLPPF